MRHKTPLNHNPEIIVFFFIDRSTPQLLSLDYLILPNFPDGTLEKILLQKIKPGIELSSARLFPHKPPLV
jgi:hypothetical protein